MRAATQAGHGAAPHGRGGRHLVMPDTDSNTQPRRDVMPVLDEPLTNGSEMTALLSALTALKKGKPGVRLPLDWTGVSGKVADAFNEVMEQNERMATGVA